MTTDLNKKTNLARPLRDWLLLVALVLIWGSAFMFNRIALHSIPHGSVVAGRIMIATLVLLAVLLIQGKRLPAWGRVWWIYTWIAVIGNVLPFYCIAWGQLVVDSALAGILIAIMPLATIILMRVFIRHEPVSRWSAIGFIVGFLGIVVLMGPATLLGLGGDGLRLWAQLAILCGAICFALQSVLTRRLVQGDFVVAATATQCVASVLMLPVVLWVEQPWQLHATTDSALALIWLGIVPTALATVWYFMLIRSAGPAFMALVNYLTPCIALLCSVGLMGETPQAGTYPGLLLILSGIALSQWRR